MDGAAVILGIDDRRRFGREPCEILRGGDPLTDILLGQEGLQRNRRRDFAGADQLRGNLVNALVQRLGKMLRVQKIRDAVERIVVDDNGAEQRLLRLDIMRRDAVVGLALRLSDNEIPASAESFDIGHRTGAPESDSASCVLASRSGMRADKAKAPSRARYRYSRCPRYTSRDTGLRLGPPNAACISPAAQISPLSTIS